MSDHHPPQSDDLKEFQEQLQVLARVHIDPRLQGKNDLSGIVNETLAEAWRDWERLRGFDEARRRAWLRRAFMKNVSDAIRKLRSRGAFDERSLNQALEDSSARVDDWLAAEESTPSERLARHETTLQIAAALSRLPERESEALILQRWHGWKLAEIAARMQCTEGAVAGLLHRGLERLRQELEQMGVCHD